MKTHLDWQCQQNFTLLIAFALLSTQDAPLGNEETQLREVSLGVMDQMKPVGFVLLVVIRDGHLENNSSGRKIL